VVPLDVRTSASQPGRFVRFGQAKGAWFADLGILLS
jgi:hypothetical protein